MRNIYITFLLSLSLQVSYSQKQIIVIDSISRKPLEYVTIINLTKNIGSYCDANGMSSKEILKDDIYKFSYIGYKDKIKKGTEIELSPLIELLPIINFLTEVNIKNNIYLFKIETYIVRQKRTKNLTISSRSSKLRAKANGSQSLTAWKSKMRY